MHGILFLDAVDQKLKVILVFCDPNIYPIMHFWAHFFTERVIPTFMWNHLHVPQDVVSLQNITLLHTWLCTVDLSPFCILYSFPKPHCIWCFRMWHAWVPTITITITYVYTHTHANDMCMLVHMYVACVYVSECAIGVACKVRVACTCIHVMWVRTTTCTCSILITIYMKYY